MPVPQFDFEKLEVYQAALEFIPIAEAIVSGLPKGFAGLGDELRRSARSTVLNIAEGAGEFSPREKARFYRMAKRSATESAAAIDVCRVGCGLDDAAASDGKSHLHRVVSMMVKMIRSTESSVQPRSEREGDPEAESW